MSAYIKHFTEIQRQDIDAVGGKGANLAALTTAGFSVPAGFCVTTRAYREFFRTFNLEAQIASKLANIDLSILENIRACGAAIRHLIEEHEISDGLKEAIIGAYQALHPLRTSPINGKTIKFSGNACHCKESSTKPSPDTGEIASQSLAMIGSFSQNLTALPIKGEGQDSPLPSWQGLGEGERGKLYVAVRSSATAEDLPHLSFAGQHDTYLNISGETDLLFYVKKCWASLWSDRALAYRHKNAVDHLQVRMAVVVQQMAPASVSGVLFTAHPVTQNQQELVLNANWGLGESVVSGKSAPDEYVVAKESLRIMRQNVAEKTLMITFGDKGAVEIPVPIAQQTQPCLTEAQIQEIAALGKQIEAYFGAPQDIEWSFVEAHVYILQSRPITTLLATPQPIPVIWANPGTRNLLPDRVVFWSNFNVRETMPYPLFPLSWSYWTEILLPLLYKHFWNVTPQSPLYPYQHCIDLVYGRVYWNLNVLYGHPFFGGIFKVFLSHIDREAGKLVETLYRGQEFRPVAFPRGIATVWFIVSNLVRTGVGFLIAPWLLTPAIIEQYWQEACAFEKLALQDQTNLELLGQVRGFTLKRWISAFLLMGHAFASCVGLAWLIKKWPDVSVNKLLAGISGNKTIEGALALYQLAEMPDALKPVFLTHPLAELPAILETNAEGRAFLQRLEHFLDLYGHRGPKEFDLGQPRWKDDPTFVLQMIKNYLQLDPQDTTPVEHFQQMATERERLTAMIRQRLAQGLCARIFPVKRWLFQAMLKRAHKYLPFRENPKYYFLKTYSGLRRIFTEIGRRLCADGYLETPDEVYFLTLPELEAISHSKANNISSSFDSAQDDIAQDARSGRTVILSGSARTVILSGVEGQILTTPASPDAIRNLVRQRQAEWQRHLAIEPPFVVRSDGKPGAYAEEIPDAKILYGTPVSGGKVTGQARIILDPAAGCAFNKGEILVAPYTDPGWTPLFLTAKAVVMEVGGVMCHGAVVAREYGLPAVVGVQQATKMIKNGDEITVDGDRGTIVIARNAI